MQLVGWIHCNVLLSVGKKQRKKYDSCKRRQCHRRQTKRMACAVGVWLKPYFFERGLGGAIKI